MRKTSNPINMSQNYQEKYFDLERNHKKLLGITMALIEALESAVSNKELNLETTLIKCMSIYPELFNVENKEQILPLSTTSNNNFSLGAKEQSNQKFPSGMQKPTILIESEEFVSSNLSSHDKLNRMQSPMSFHISFPTQKTTNESYSDSEAYTALKTINNPCFLRANSISVTDKNKIIDVPNYTDFTLENGNIITQNLPMVLTAKAFDVCSQLKINFNDDNTISNSIVVHQQGIDENMKNKTFTHKSFVECEDDTNGEENFQLKTKAVNQLNNLSNGVKSRQKLINESSAEDTDGLLNIDYETFAMNKPDKTNQTSERSYFHKIKHGIIFNSIDKQVKILETLRKKLIHSLAQDRANTLDIYINHDIFDIHSHQILFKKLLPLGLVNGWDLKLQQVILKFINSVSSIQKGRDYLTSNNTLAKYLCNLIIDKNHQKGMCITKNKEMIMAIFHKLSVKQNQQSLLKTIIQNVVTDLLENQNLTFYQIRHTLGYLINMCLIPENMCTIEKFASDLLQMLGNLLLTKDLKILTEVDRLLYILMSNSKFQQEAKNLNLPVMIKQISEKCNKRLKSQLERVISVMTMPVPHNNLETVKDEYLNYIEIELNELEEEVELGETTSVIDIKEIIKEEKNQLFNNTNCIDENSIKNKIEKTIPKECVENINSESSTFEGDSFLPSLEKKEDAIFNQTKRFIQEHEIKKSEMKLNNKFNSTKTGFKKRGNDDRNNNSLLVKNIVVKPESSFIVLDDSPVKTKKSKIKKTKISQDFIKNKEQIHKKDQDINFESYDYCEETKQIQVPLQHGNIFNVYRHSPYKEFIENESVNKTRPNSRAD